jgi:hypothetical protein
MKTEISSKLIEGLRRSHFLTDIYNFESSLKRGIVTHSRYAINGAVHIETFINDSMPAQPALPLTGASRFLIVD